MPERERDREKVTVQAVYHNDFFDKGFVAAQSGPLHSTNIGSQPRYEEKLGSLAHLIAALQDEKKKINK